MKINPNCPKDQEVTIHLANGDCVGTATNTKELKWFQCQIVDQKIEGCYVKKGAKKYHINTVDGYIGSEKPLFPIEQLLTARMLGILAAYADPTMQKQYQKLFENENKKH